MSSSLSPRLLAIVDALPLKPGLRVLEIGCGPGALARELAHRIGARGAGHVLAIDRSSKAIAQARAAAHAEIAAGRLSLRHVAIEDFQLAPGEAPYDLAIAIRVGALDGRHHELEAQALQSIASALTPKGRLFIDGSPVREIPLSTARQKTKSAADSDVAPRRCRSCA